MHTGIARSILPVYNRSTENTFTIDDDIADIFGQILQFLYSGEYSVPTLASDGSSHVACEDVFEDGVQRLLPLKNDYFLNHEDLRVQPNHLISMPCCGEDDYLCKHPETLLMHARLYAFATNNGLDQLQYISIHRLYWTLSEFPLDMERTKGIVKLIRFSNGEGAVGVLPTLMVHYVSLHLKFLVCFPSFLCLLQEQPDLSCCLIVSICDPL